MLYCIGLWTVIRVVVFTFVRLRWLGEKKCPPDRRSAVNGLFYRSQAYASDAFMPCWSASADSVAVCFNACSYWSWPSCHRAECLVFQIHASNSFYWFAFSAYTHGHLLQVLRWFRICLNWLFGPAICLEFVSNDSYLVDPASSHMLVSKIKPCMSKYKHLYCETANGSLNQLSFIWWSLATWIPVVILELIHATTPDFWKGGIY